MAKRGTLEHPKFARLKMRLKLNKAEALGYLETLWQFAGRFTPQGNVGKYSDADIEAWLEWDGEPGALVSAMVECGWLDQHDEHRLLIHDWADHVDHTTRTALRRQGLDPLSCANTVLTPCEQSENSARTVSDSVRTECAPPEPEPEPEPKPDNPPISPRGASVEVDASPRKKPGPAKAELDELWDRFLAVYPGRKGDSKRAKGREKFDALVKNGVDPERMIAGAERYRRFMQACRKVGTEYVQQLTTFLNNRAWEEEFDVPDAEPDVSESSAHILEDSVMVLMDGVEVSMPRSRAQAQGLEVLDRSAALTSPRPPNGQATKPPGRVNGQYDDAERAAMIQEQIRQAREGAGSERAAV